MTINYNIVTPSWNDSHLYGPASRWRRRIILKILKKLQVLSCIDVGCAQPFLLLSLRHLGIECSGCDISETVIEENKKLYPDMQFFVSDLQRKMEIQSNKKADVVICSEVLEHLDDYKTAIRNICALSKKYVLITVPMGKRYPIDLKVGHMQHFSVNAIINPLERNGFRTVEKIKWGFPFHSLYKYLINLGGGNGISEKYSSGSYGRLERLVASCVDALFTLNVFPFGNQLILLAEKKHMGG